MTTVPVFPNACNPQINSPTFILRPWSRDSGQTCIPMNVATPKQLDWRRKVEILKYNPGGNKQTQAQRYKRVATNTLVRKSQTYAVQNLNQVPKNTNPNIKNLPIVNNTLQLPCSNQPVTYTYGADVPGPDKPLFPIPANIPLTRYNPPQRTYRAGGEKWPQWGWYPGANGFPVGKKGKG